MSINIFPIFSEKTCLQMSESERRDLNCARVIPFMFEYFRSEVIAFPFLPILDFRSRADF